MERKLQAETQARAEAEKQIESEKAAKRQLEEELKEISEEFQEFKNSSEARTKQAIQEVIKAKEKEMLAKIETAPTEKTGKCECCGKDNIKVGELIRIDSGQFFCSECLTALRGGLS